LAEVANLVQWCDGYNFREVSRPCHNSSVKYKDRVLRAEPGDERRWLIPVSEQCININLTF
jgi:hypothetical protein